MKYLESPIFYMGNKYKMLGQLIPLFPKECNTFLDLFGGSGVVSMNYKGIKKTIYNEFNHNIVGLIKMFKENNPVELDSYFKSKIAYYNLGRAISKGNSLVDTTDLINKYKINYNKFRSDYNAAKDENYKDLFLLACYSINHLIRFNKNSEFNASYGTNQEYTNNIYNRIVNMHKMFQDVEISHNDCFDLDLSILQKEDFVYCDPPYLNTEAVYNERRAFGGWNIEHDYKLFEILEELNKRGVRWGLSNVFVNRGKENTHLIEWCEKNQWQVYHLNRNYNPFSRGNSNNDEVYICNYGLYDIKGCNK